jgi:hypothetical protein
VTVERSVHLTDMRLPREEKTYVLQTLLTLPTIGGPPLDLEVGVSPQSCRYSGGHVTVIIIVIESVVPLGT